MKNVKKIFLILAFYFSQFVLVTAQEFPYDLIVETDTYSELIGAIELTSVGDFWDDPNFEIPIGFEFEISGNSFDSTFITGYFLGGVLLFKNQINPKSPMIIANMDDILDIEHLDSTMQSTISYLTEGMIGERIFKLEWNNCIFVGGEIDESLSMQVWLYENSNNIDIRFGPNNIPNPWGGHAFNRPYCGIVEDYFGSFLGTEVTYFWSLNGEPSNPSVETFNTLPNLFTFDNDGLDAVPSEGQVYRFTNMINNIKENSSKELPMKVYPSIVENGFTIEVNQDVLVEKTKMIIVNNLGQEIFSKDIIESKELIDMTNFPKELYYVSIVNEKGKGVRKIIK